MYRTVCTVPSKTNWFILKKKIAKIKDTDFLTKGSDLDLDPAQLFRIRILPGHKVDPPASMPLL
jgi:hypothetical protein